MGLNWRIHYKNGSYEDTENAACFAPMFYEGYFTKNMTGVELIGINAKIYSQERFIDWLKKACPCFDGRIVSTDCRADECLFVLSCLRYPVEFAMVDHMDEFIDAIQQVYNQGGDRGKWNFKMTPTLMVCLSLVANRLRVAGPHYLPVKPLSMQLWATSGHGAVYWTNITSADLKSLTERETFVGVQTNLLEKRYASHGFSSLPFKEPFVGEVNMGSRSKSSLVKRDLAIEVEAAADYRMGAIVNIQLVPFYEIMFKYIDSLCKPKRKKKCKETAGTVRTAGTAGLALI